MRMQRYIKAFVLPLLGFFATCALGDDHKSLPSCTQLEGKVVTLRGKVSEAWDNMSPDEDLGVELVLDPMETILVMILPSPICRAPEKSKRPVVQSEVTEVEIVLSDNASAKYRRSHVGQVRTITGKLSENVWWHYRATMQIAVAVEW